MNDRTYYARPGEGVLDLSLRQLADRRAEIDSEIEATLHDVPRPARVLARAEAAVLHREPRTPLERLVLARGAVETEMLEIERKLERAGR